MKVPFFYCYGDNESTDVQKDLVVDVRVADIFGCLNAKGFSARVTYYIGKDGKILHIDKKVKSKSHGEDIAKMLEEQGINVARRTIAKYREAMNIAPSNERKRLA